MRKIIIAILLQLPLLVMAEPYTLRQCIDSALVNNISVQQQRNQYDAYRLQYKQQKYNLLPSVSGNIGQSFSFGRATGADNVTVSQNMANTSFGLSANLLIFDGLGMKYRIDEARQNMEATEAETEKLEADIRMNIATMFLQILLNKELLVVADTQLEATRLKLEQQEQMVNEGRLAEGELYTMRAQYSKEEYSRIQAQNNVYLSLLDMAQAMNVAYNDDFDIVTPPADELEGGLLPANEDVWRAALQNRPEIKAAEAQLKAQETALKGAKSAYSPTLSASAGVGTGYYHRFGAENDAFGTQLGNNLSTNVGLNLTIPIFDRMQTPNTVKKQKINIENQKLQISQTKQTLRKEIDQAYYNAIAAQTQQLSAEKAAESAKEAYRYAEQKAEAGRASMYEYYDAKNTYFKAQSEYLQAKYNYLFKLRILNYYQGMP